MSSLLRFLRRHLTFSTWKSSPKAPPVYEIGWKIELGNSERARRNRKSGISGAKVPRSAFHHNRQSIVDMKFLKILGALKRAGQLANEVTSGKKTNTGLVILAVSTALDVLFNIQLDPEIYTWGIEQFLAYGQIAGIAIAAIGLIHKDIKEGNLKRKIEEIYADKQVTLEEIISLVGDYTGAKPAPEKPFAHAVPVGIAEAEGEINGILERAEQDVDGDE